MRKREREIQGRERDREKERERESERDGGERENITNTKKIMECYLVMLHSGLRSEA